MLPNNVQIYPLLPAISVVANADFNSIPQWVDKVLRASISAIVTGTVNGTIQLQGSNQKAIGLPANQFVPSSWFNIGSTVALTSAGEYALPSAAPCYYEISFEYLRIVFTDASSGSATGTIQLRMSSKAL